MFDVAPTELLLVAFIALVVIGPKDLPKAMRVVGYWVGRARGVGRQFRSGFDAMVREAELEEMEKKWAEENERIMRMHPATPMAAPVDAADPAPEAIEDHPVMVERPRVEAAPATDHVATDQGIPDRGVADRGVADRGVSDPSTVAPDKAPS